MRVNSDANERNLHFCRRTIGVGEFYHSLTFDSHKFQDILEEKPDCTPPRHETPRETPDINESRTVRHHFAALFPETLQVFVM